MKGATCGLIKTSLCKGPPVNTSQNITVSVIVPSLSGGGGERAAIKLAQGLSLQGYSVELVVVDPAGPLKDFLPPTIRAVYLNRHRMRRGILPLARYLRLRRPKAIISFLVQGNVATVLAAKLSRVNTSVFLVEQNEQSTDRDSGEYLSPLMRRLVRLTYPRASTVVAVSQGAADAIIRLTGTANVTVIHNPVVDDTMLALGKQNCAHPWLKDGNVPVLLNIGRLSHQKNQSLLLRAFARIRATRDLRLIILGEGELRDSLEAEAKALGIEDDVDMPGFVENPYVYLVRAAVFVLSSRFEGLPTVLIEALASGCNVVSVDCPSGPDEILENGKFGGLSKPDEGELARAIIEKLNNPLPQDVLRKRASDFDVASSVAAYAGLLSGLGVVPINQQL